jgi:hypothetical protein
MANTSGSGAGNAQDATVQAEETPESTKLGDDRAVLEANVEAMKAKVDLEKDNVKAAEKALKAAEQELADYED